MRRLAIVPSDVIPTPDFDAFVEHLKLSHLLCRDMGHAWRPRSAVWSQRERAYEVVRRCSRCHTERIMLLSDRGGVLESWYRYAEGYLVKGVGRIVGEQRDAVRLATVLRTSSDDRQTEEE